MMSAISEKPRIVILEIGDIRTDGRCRNIARSCVRSGAEVFFIGPAQQNETAEIDGIVIRYIGVVGSFGSKIRYVHYWIRSFIECVRLRPDLIIAEDLFVMPAAVAYALTGGSRILYDAKEFYFALAALKDRPSVQRFWSFIEYLCIHYADAVITSGERDNVVLAERYRSTNPVAIHNHPPGSSEPPDRKMLRDELHIDPDAFVFLYQGWLLEGRGLPLMIRIASELSDCTVVILGDGPMRRVIESEVDNRGMKQRFVITGSLPYEEMLRLTAVADVGCALIEDYGMSYRHARPNKLFEYIRAGVPVLTSDFPAMAEIVRDHGVGLTADPSDPDKVVESALRLRNDPELLLACRSNCKRAAAEFTWEEEEKKLLSVLHTLGLSRAQ